MKRLIALLACALCVACVPDTSCRAPFGEGGTIDLSMPEFSALANPGGSLTINRGYRGIIITRISFVDFVAFDCACPNDNDERLLPDATWGNTILTCPACHSSFNALDGTPLDGAATPCLLYQYSTHFDGQYLAIY